MIGATFGKGDSVPFTFAGGRVTVWLPSWLRSALLFLLAATAFATLSLMFYAAVYSYVELNRREVEVELLRREVDLVRRDLRAVEDDLDFHGRGQKL